jgi:HlyD family secretion protein
MIVFATSCDDKSPDYDATGTFEAEDLIISAEIPGKIVSFSAREGASLQVGDTVVRMDPVDIELQKLQLQATIQSLDDKLINAKADIEVIERQTQLSKAEIQTLKTQLQVLNKEKERISRLHKKEAATEKQLDDIVGQVDIQEARITSAMVHIDILDSQIKAARMKERDQNRAINSERVPLDAKIDQLEEQISKASIINPIQGTLLTKYAYEGEIIGVGKPLYKLANLDYMTLRAYVSGAQLSAIKLGQKVSIIVDRGIDETASYRGEITWISDEAEFTPKTIQTKDERTQLVYAIKIGVENDGYLKIGMYGEVLLNDNTPGE